MVFEEFVDDFHHSAAQTLDGGKLAYIHAGQLLGKRRFVAGGKTPVGEVVGESMPDEVMLLQGTKGMLEDRILGTGFDPLEQFGKRVRFLPSDAQQVL